MTNAENSTIEPTAEAVVADASAPATERAPDAGVTETAATQTDAAEDAKTETASEANGSDSSAPAQDVAATEGESADGETSEAEPAPAGEPAARPEPVTDEVLLASVDIARAALLEVTPAETIGEPVGHVAEDDHVLSLFFDSKLRGYPGWHWTVTLARTDDGPVTVLETEMMPGDNALLAPEWVPWSERLADYQAGQENEARALAEAAALLGDDEDEDDEEEFSILHAGDVDGVDVDEADESDADDDDSDDDESDDDESDDDDDESDDDDDESNDDEDGPERSY